MESYDIFIKEEPLWDKEPAPGIDKGPRELAPNIKTEHITDMGQGIEQSSYAAAINMVHVPPVKNEQTDVTPAQPISRFGFVDVNVDGVLSSETKIVPDVDPLQLTSCEPTVIKHEIPDDVNVTSIEVSKESHEMLQNDQGTTERLTSQLLSSPLAVLEDDDMESQPQRESHTTTKEVSDDETVLKGAEDLFQQEVSKYKILWQQEIKRNKCLQAEIDILKGEGQRSCGPLCQLIDKKQLLSVLGLPVDSDATIQGKTNTTLFQPQEQEGVKVELCRGSSIFISESRRAIVLMRSGGCPKKIVRNTLLEFYSKEKLAKMTALGRNNTDCIPKPLLNTIFGFANNKMCRKDSQGNLVQPLSYSDFVKVVNQKCSNERKWIKIKGELLHGKVRKRNVTMKIVKKSLKNVKDTELVQADNSGATPLLSEMALLARSPHQRRQPSDVPKCYSRTVAKKK